MGLSGSSAYTLVGREAEAEAEAEAEVGVAWVAVLIVAVWLGGNDMLDSQRVKFLGGHDAATLWRPLYKQLGSSRRGIAPPAGCARSKIENHFNGN
jgi:hypothetical protein